MKKIILTIMLFLAGQAFAQGVAKSELISKEIQSLEFENNKIILSEYIKEQCDSTSCIPIYNLGKKLISDFQNSHKELKVLKEEYDLNVKAIDKIKYRDSEYRKYRENYVGSSGEARKKQEAIYRSIHNRLYKSNENFKALSDKNRKILSRLNYLTLVQIATEYHHKGEVLPTRFIPYTDMSRYKELSKVKENQKKIDALNTIYRKVIEKEFQEKYNVNDSIKREKIPSERTVVFD